MGDQLIEWMQADASNLMLEAFFVEELGLYAEIVAYLVRKFPGSHFARCVKKAKQIQHNRLVIGGLKREYHSGMAIFLLKCNHGLRDAAPIEPVTIDVEAEKVDMNRSTTELLSEIRSRIGK